MKFTIEVTACPLVGGVRVVEDRGAILDGPRVATFHEVGGKLRAERVTAVTVAEELADALAHLRDLRGYTPGGALWKIDTIEGVE